MARHLPTINALSLVLFAAIFFALIPDYEWIAALAYLPIIIILAKLLFDLFIRSSDPSFSPTLFLFLFMVKMLGALARYWMIADVYGRGDAFRYHLEGQRLADFYARFDFSVLGDKALQGTEAMEHLTGFFYTFLPVSFIGICLLFAALSFFGCIFFYRAFQLAFPATNPKLYRFLLFLLPSIFFWPSSLGKDAWTFFGSGFVVYGLVRLTRLNEISGLLTMGLGLLLVGLIRPHIAAFMVISIAVAYLPFFFRAAKDPQHLLAWLIGGAGAVAIGIYFLQSGAAFLQGRGLGELTGAGVEEYYYIRQRSVYYGGGSGFAPTVALDLAGVFAAPVIVLLRPFIWEAHNPQALLTALESLLWLGVILKQRKIFWQRLRRIATDPVVAFALVLSLLMIVSLTTLGNFGLLARQRVTLLPFLWILFA